MENHIKLLNHKKQIILQGPPGTGKTRLAEELAFKMITNNELSEVEDRKKALNDLKEIGQLAFVQFHPSYSYEDFVRGIKVSSEGENVKYDTVNRIFMEMVDMADKSSITLKEQNIDEVYKGFIDNEIIKEIETKGTLEFNNENNSRVYKVELTNNKNGIRIHSKNTLTGISFITGLEYIKGNFQHKTTENNTYYKGLKLKFENYLKNNEISFDNTKVDDSKVYVLIIDEINRANLPSVLGELIYGLEYRGSYINLMYTIEREEDSKVNIPDNLYIIGTMNTADRSVGTIDYAIRRRFAFVDVLPNIEVVSDFAKEKFRDVQHLFINNTNNIGDNSFKPENRSEHLSSEFNPKEVAIGHSYFIAKNKEEFELKLRYEIIPILDEYVKDGILQKSAEEIIKSLL